MNRLMKAEGYRLAHSGNLFAWIIFLNLFIVVLQYSMAYEISKVDFANALFLVNENGLAVAVVLGLLTSVIVVLLYQNRVGYYEIMSGHKISHILWSKMLVDGFVITGILIVFFGISFVIFGLKNGVGEWDNFQLRIILDIIILFHISIVATLLSCCCRHLVVSVLVYLRFMAFDMILLFLTGTIMGKEELADKILDYTIAGQFQLICTETLNADIVFPIILSTIIECGFLYSIAYITMKKKLYR